MDRDGNPFVPGAGSQPFELTGRDALLEDARVSLARTKAGRFEKSIILTGLRGVGKTVLLNRIERLALDLGYQTQFIEVPEKDRMPALLVPALRRILLDLDRGARVGDQARRAWGSLKSFARSFKVKYGDLEVGLDLDKGVADSGMLDRDLTDVFLMVGRAAQEAGGAAALLFDEVQYFNEEELSALIAAQHRVVQQNLPLTLFAAGLPQIAALAGDAKSYAERLFAFSEVGALDAVSATRAIVEPIERAGERIDPEAAAAIVAVTEGYPYFLQEWGYHAWNVAAQSPVTALDVQQATVDAVARLDRSFFRVRFDRLTPNEKLYLRAMAELGPGPHRSGDVAAAMEKKVSQAAPIRESLIKKGMIYSQVHGETAFTVPLFDVFMRRSMPEFSAGA
jgi:AAA ATPase domain